MSVTIEEIHTMVSELDSTIPVTSNDYMTGVVLLSILLHQQSPESVARFAGYDLDYVWSRVYRANKFGILQGASLHCEWLEEFLKPDGDHLTASVSFWLDVMTMEGVIKRGPEHKDNVFAYRFLTDMPGCPCGKEAAHRDDCDYKAFLRSQIKKIRDKVRVEITPIPDIETEFLSIPDEQQEQQSPIIQAKAAIAETVTGYLNEGHTHREASEHFNIARNTVAAYDQREVKLCPCGQPSSHKGLCATRLEKVRATRAKNKVEKEKPTCSVCGEPRSKWSVDKCRKCYQTGNPKRAERSTDTGQDEDNSLCKFCGQRMEHENEHIKDHVLHLRDEGVRRFQIAERLQISYGRVCSYLRRNPPESACDCGRAANHTGMCSERVKQQRTEMASATHVDQEQPEAQEIEATDINEIESEPEATLSTDEALEAAKPNIEAARGIIRAKQEENILRSKSLKEYQQKVRQGNVEQGSEKKAPCGVCVYRVLDGHKLLGVNIDCPEHGTSREVSRHTAGLGQSLLNSM